MQNNNQDNVSCASNKGVNLSIELPKSFSHEDAEKIKADLFDFFEKKNNYGANYGKKEGIKIKTILWSANDA
jgi:hypothetical protein